jgi:hypothetical protein
MKRTVAFYLPTSTYVLRPPSHEYDAPQTTFGPKGTRYGALHVDLKPVIELIVTIALDHESCISLATPDVLKGHPDIVVGFLRLVGTESLMGLD